MKQSLFAVFCFAICGCSFLDTDIKCGYPRTYPYWTDWGDSRLVSFASDSLAVLVNHKYKLECRHQDNKEVIVSSRTGLSLVNYRVKQKPLSVDTLDYSFGNDNPVLFDYIHDYPYFQIFRIANYFKDSSVLVLLEKGKKFGIWKLGTKSINFKEYINPKDCNLVANTIPWINGNILFNNTYSSCELDTKTGQIKFLDYFSEEYEWLRKCSSISYIGEKIVCVKAEYGNFELIADNIVTEAGKFKGLETAGFSNGYLILSFYEASSKIVYKIDTENFKFSNDFTSVRIKYIDRIRFYMDNNNPDDFIYYSSDDLFGIGN